MILYLYIYLYIYIPVFIYIYIFVYIYTYITVYSKYIYIYIYIHTQYYKNIGNAGNDGCEPQDSNSATVRFFISALLVPWIMKSQIVEYDCHTL